MGIAPLQAQGPHSGARETKAAPVITSTSVTQDQQTIVITGSGFGDVAPRVKLGATPLGAVTVDAGGTTVTAALPSGTSPAAYEVVVTRVSRPAGSTSAVLVVGAQGPKGATGLQGIMGPQGPAGPQGQTGAQGVQGPKGDAGAAGAVGPHGAAGDTGAAGPVGPQGAKGDTGAAGAIGPQGPQGASGNAIDANGQLTAPGTVLDVNVLPAGPQSPQALDASMTSFNIGIACRGVCGQSFTPTVNGKLTRFDVYKNGITGTQTVTVKLYSGNGTGGAALLQTQAVLPNVSTPTAITFTTAEAPLLQAGTTYTLEITDPSNTFNTLGMTGNPYAGGQISEPGGVGNYFTDRGTDLWFRSYITAESYPGSNVHLTQAGNVGIGTTAPTDALHLASGELFISTPGAGILLKSPDGATCAVIALNNAGTVVTSLAACK